MKRLLVLALVLSTNSYAADIKKWVDEKGQIHYGDTAPAQIHTESVRVNRPPSNPGKPLPRFSDPEKADPGKEEQPAKPPQQQEQAAKPEVDGDQARSLCEEARKDLEKINRSNNIRVRSSDGSIRYLGAEEKEERRKQSEEDIQQFCK